MPHLPVRRAVLLEQLLSQGRRYTLGELCEKLDCSRATFMRARRELVKSRRMPVVCGPDGLYGVPGGWRGARASRELPRLYLSEEELAAFVTLGRIAEQLEPGMFRAELRKAWHYLRDLPVGPIPSALLRRIKVLPMNRRAVPGPVFETVCAALTRSVRLSFQYPSPPDAAARRTVSPQNLVRYRDNWYLDAWCHERRALRTFSLHRMLRCRLESRRARRIRRRDLEHHFASSYGIFSGTPVDTAVIRFFDTAARYVSNEEWHPRQQGCWKDERTFELRIPYSDLRELLGDVAAWGPEAEIVAPAALRGEMKIALRDALKPYD